MQAIPIAVPLPQARLLELPDTCKGVKAFAYVKTCAAITLIASVTFAACATAYLLPGTSLLSMLGVAVINVYAIPALLSHGHHSWARTALVVNLVASGSLFMGGATGISIAFSQYFISALQKLSWQGALWSAYAVTCLMGYAAPAGLIFLKRAYSIINEANWQEKLSSLGEHLSHLTATNQNFFNQFLDNCSLIAALSLPEEISTWRRNFEVTMPFKLLTVLHILCAQSALDSWYATLSIMKSLIPMTRYADIQEAKKYSEPLLNHLTSTIYRLNEKELALACTALLDKLPEFIPHFFTIDQVKGFFTGKILNETLRQIESFITSMHVLDEFDLICNQMDDRLKDLEKDAESITPNKKDVLKKHLEEFNEDFLSKRQKLEKIYLDNKRWQAFLHLPPAYLHFLPNPHLLALHQVISPEMTNHISKLYLSAMGMQNVEGQLGNILSRMHRLSGKLSQTDEDLDPVSAWEFLGDNRCGFIIADYEHLQQWLKADSLPEIEAKLEAIGLATEEDLYKNHILPRQGVVKKTEIKKKLHAFIMEQTVDKRDIRTRIYSSLASLKQISPTLGSISAAVSKIVYRLATMGMILVPILMYPTASAVGFGGGLLFFTLRRFGVRYTEEIADFFTGIHRHGIGSITRLITDRNFFSLTSRSRNNMATFARADLFGRMRLLNFEILATLAIIYAQFSDSHYNREQFGAGGFLQGIALSREVVHLI
jgi:hypothetical protein